MNVLFICNWNQNRSKTAEELFRKHFQTRSAGLYNNPVTVEQISWAELIVVMEEEMRTELSRRFPALYLRKQIISLDIPNIYRYNQPELIALLEEKAELLEPFMELR